MNKLQLLNAGSAALQAILCIAMIVLLLTDRVQEPENMPAGIASFRGITWSLVAFTATTAITHGYYALNTDTYSRMVDGGNNMLRWAEYSVTATIMLVAVAMISGVTQIDSLILIGAASLATMLLGQVVEASPGNKGVQVVASLSGWSLLVAAFVVIFKNFVEAVRAAQSSSPSSPGPPSFVYVIVIGMFLLYGSFGGVQLVRNVVRTGTTAAYHRQTEAAYSVTSMVAKTLLVGSVLSGVIGAGGGSSS
jgi:hypothetical protein